MIGRQLTHFRLIEKIGEGGMGVVYKAHDERLGRNVAIKVLPAESLGDPASRSRLLREARTASKLNHPNICTIHEVGEAEGQAFIAMELVEGKPVSALVKGGALPGDQVLRYGLHMADALAHAHERGVVHRDLKSANVVVTPEGRAKVLDFGLARRMTVDDIPESRTLTQPTLTMPGQVVGTLAYMAPEQLRGQPADERSDVWALGVVLYEMAAGVRPFQGETSFELSSSILNQKPPLLRAGTRGAPPVLFLSVIERCLEKDPERRYQKAGEVRAALEAVQAGAGVPVLPALKYALKRHRKLALAAVLTAAVAVIGALDVGGLRNRLLRGAPGPAFRTLAVLPVANLSGDPEQEYFTDGMTDALITDLSKIGALRVISRTSVMRYKNTRKSLKEIARELNVEAVLEASVVREADRVRVTAQLGEAATERNLWAESFEREYSSILAIQAEVARHVADTVRVKLSPEERARLGSARKVNPEAHDAYLRGSSHWKKMTPADLDTAESYFELAIEKDPSYAPAYEGLAWVWAVRNQFSTVPPHEGGPKAKAAALQAIKLDDSYAGAHEVLATVMTYTDWDWAGAEPEWRLALELDPNAANAHAYFAHFLAITGRTDEAVPHSERSLELDPFNALFQSLYAVVLYFDRRYDDALAAARTALTMQPDLRLAQNALRHIFFSKGMRDEQLAHQRERIASDPELLAAFEQGLVKAGYEGAMRGIADVLEERYWETDGIPEHGSGRSYMPVAIARRYLYAGDYDRAIDWFERAYQDHDPALPYLRMPLHDPLRSDPRFKNLLRQMGLPED